MNAKEEMELEKERMLVNILIEIIKERDNHIEILERELDKKNN